jgi:hypothetical protein
MSKERTRKDAGWVNPKALPKGPNGRPLCRWCGTEVQPPRFTFCNDDCVHEWKLRSDPGYARNCVFRRDRGVCATCGVKTLKDREFLATYMSLPKPPRSPWQMDHILPVVEGGGECGLDNLRTLCYICHQRVTAELAKRRAEERRAKKEQP